MCVYIVYGGGGGGGCWGTGEPRSKKENQPVNNKLNPRLGPQIRYRVSGWEVDAVTTAPSFLPIVVVRHIQLNLF